MDDVTPKFDVVTDSEVSVAGPEMKKKDLIEAVAERADMKKGMVKQVVEATLAVLGESLAKGDVMNLQPLGKIQILNQKDTPNARILKCKVRQAKSDEDRAEADDVDDAPAIAQAEPAAAPAPEAAPAVDDAAARVQAVQQRPRRKLSLSASAAE